MKMCHLSRNCFNLKLNVNLSGSHIHTYVFYVHTFTGHKRVLLIHKIIWFFVYLSFCPFIRKLCQLSTMTKKHKSIYVRLSAIKLFYPTYYLSDNDSNAPPYSVTCLHNTTFYQTLNLWRNTQVHKRLC